MIRRSLVQAKKNMCVSDFPTDSPFSRRSTQVFYCATHSSFVFWDHIENKIGPLWRSYEGLFKISAQMDTFLIFEEKSHFRDNTKILHAFFAYRLSGFFYCATQFFLLRIIYTKNDVNRTIGFVGLCNWKYIYFLLPHLPCALLQCGHIMIYNTNQVYHHMPNAFGFWQIRLHLR